MSSGAAAQFPSSSTGCAVVEMSVDQPAEAER